MPPCSRTLSPSFFSSNWNPYWKPEHPPPWTKIRSGFSAESGIVEAKYLTFSTAASVSARRGFLAAPGGVLGGGRGRGLCTVSPFFAPALSKGPDRRLRLHG